MVVGKRPRLPTIFFNSDPMARRNLLTRTNPLGKTWNYTWDNSRNLTKLKDPLNNEVNLTYDTKGNLQTLENGLGQTVFTGTYTARGELAAITDGRSKTTTFEYDTNGFLTKATDAAGKD